MDQLNSKLREKKLTKAQLENLKKTLPEMYEEYMASRNVMVELQKFITAPSGDDQMVRMKEEIILLSEVDDPVLIMGETGTGKETLARALHGDREGEFIPINCAGIPETLIESELFGHVKGAFTGAVQDKTGLLHSAQNGTVFLDEIGDLPLSMQAKLLRALQEKKIRRVGADYERGDKEININCRFIAATHKNLEAMVKDETFREDLYYRISMQTITTLPLRERSAVIRPLIKHLIIKEKDDVNFDIEDIDEFANFLLKNRQQLTGNVRQLQNIIRQYHVLGKKPTFK